MLERWFSEKKFFGHASLESGRFLDLALGTGLLIGGLLIGGLSGCGGTESIANDSAAVRIRAEMLVQEMPLEVQSLKSACSSLDLDPVITVAGRIYAESVSPFDPKESSFTIIELPKPGHRHEDPGDCPFCKRELKNAMIAIVKVVDESGQTLTRPADQLLGLKKNLDIAVTGAAEMVGDTLIVRTRQLHLLSAEDAQSLSVAFHRPPVSPSAE